ncbi:MAG: GDP-mannose 4,6-dehydratase [Candidatus Rokubacteria bacterium]|nr:GDP-mannose 4,6-dehydratase [Candidatus Rokubacteria bacterium]
MRVLITGITGFVGSHLAEYALKAGAEVVGSLRWRSRLEHVEGIRQRVRLIECDLRDAMSTRALVAQAKPDRVFHLAAQSFVQASFNAPAESLHTNVICQVNLLEGLRAERREPRILVVGSSEEYGLVHEHETPITEQSPLRPLSPYAVSKVTQDLMGYQYWKSYGQHIVRSRAFNHSGPRRGDVFATSTFARQIAEIEAGVREPVIHVGNLTPRRDFSDVRDIVRGYWLMLERGEPGEVYNLCAGRAWSIRWVLDFLLAESKTRDVSILEHPDRLRPSDVPLLLGDGGKIAKALGWRTEIPFEQTLRDLLDYWRQRVRA